MLAKLLICRNLQRSKELFTNSINIINRTNPFQDIRISLEQPREVLTCPLRNILIFQRYLFALIIASPLTIVKRIFR